MQDGNTLKNRVNRQPTLHEYGMFAMKMKLVDDYAIHFPIAVCQPLNADFDGDTCALQLVPEEAAQDTYEKMSPRFVNVYKKNNKPIYPFNLETLNGLNVATEVTPDDPKDIEEPRYFYNDYATLLKDVEVEKKIKIGTPIVFTGKLGGVDFKEKKTTYGRLRISKILETDLDKTKILDSPTEAIRAKSAGKLSEWMNGDPKGVEKRLALQKFALRAVTLAGVVTFDYKTLFVDTNTDLYKEICKVADSKDYTDQQKIAILTEKYAAYEKEIESKFSEDLKVELDRAGKIKLSSISALNMPQLILSGVDEIPIITRGSLLQGYSEKDMIYHSVENRSLQSIKQSGTPTSGWLTRQITFILNSFVYHEGVDVNNPGILLPRYKAGGRTAPDGTLYPEKNIKATAESENDLVPVRSIISKNTGDLSTVTPDLIGTKFKDLTDGTAIGLSFATSLTEGSTQSALGLKHGGHERILDKSFYLKAPEKCDFREEGTWLYLKSKKGELKYPRPINFVNVGKDKFEKGESVGVAYQTVSPISQVNTLIDFIGARRSAGSRYYEKDTVIISDCYAYEDGVINYVEEGGSIVEVRIGSKSYQYNPKCIYYYPEGSQVKKFDRICSGVVNMSRVISGLGNNLSDIYLIFRKQFLTISDKDFQKTGVSSLSGTQEELIELLFRGLTLIEYDPKKLEIESIEYKGSQRSITSRNSFFTVLSYGYGSQVVNRAIKGEIELTGDIMAETVLGLLLNNKLDEK